MQEKPAFVALVATRDRPQLLEARALASLTAQTRPPDLLVVVDDSTTPAARARNRALLAKIPNSVYLENQRTSGISGAYNTAADQVVERDSDPSAVFLAFLDDDDAWPPEYLQRCAELLSASGPLDMLAAGLHRREAETCLQSEAPERLCAEDLLVGNPGIQSSNLVLRLSVFLAAGGFDERLKSTTDRDLCIRICDLGTVRYAPLSGSWVEHFADRDRPRLSTPGSAAKRDGLSAFFQKYRGRMNAEQRRAFCARASELFDWEPPFTEDYAHRESSPQRAVILGLRSAGGQALSGVVTQLTQFKDERLVGLDVVLLGIEPEIQADLDEAADQLREAGLGAFVLREHLAPEDAAAILAARCAHIAEARKGAEPWICAEPAQGALPSGARVEELLRWLRAQPLEAARLKDPAEIDRWILQERTATAAHRVRRRFSVDRLKTLGAGSEAVVFTDGQRVYKCIDYWKTRMPRGQLEFLRAQIGRWDEAFGLYPLETVEEDGPWALIVYRYEDSEAYTGGREQEMIRLLRACRDRGVVCNNIHPKNLIVTKSGLKLIDYGSDIHPWSPIGFEHMARRAFLACRHADHPDLPSLMRRALSDPSLPQLEGFAAFSAGVDIDPAPKTPLTLYVGVITADPLTLKPLLEGLRSLRAGLKRLVVLVLDNGSPPGQLAKLAEDLRAKGLELSLVGEAEQRADAEAGRFGAGYAARPSGQVGIAQARTMLQRYLGALLSADPGSFGWLLDDDMRVDARAAAYLAWLPVFAARGVDVLIGAYEGSSPNPPLNGLRVQLVDLLHNLHWLRGLPEGAALPDRALENRTLRAAQPDYYYDLSRKHSAHLEAAYWLEPAFAGETVRQARDRLLSQAGQLLEGVQLTRPLIAAPALDPLSSARDSVNRGGCTFILNPRALTETPNLIPNIDGRPARRSDMIWAILNRYYRGMKIQSVGFAVTHLGRQGGPSPQPDLEKVQEEIIGSTLYAALTDFLRERPTHKLDFTEAEADEIYQRAERQLRLRRRALFLSLHRIAGLKDALSALPEGPALSGLIEQLGRLCSSAQAGAPAHNRAQLTRFARGLCASADDYASKSVEIGFIQDQL